MHELKSKFQFGKSNHYQNYQNTNFTEITIKRLLRGEMQKYTEFSIGIFKGLWEELKILLYSSRQKYIPQIHECRSKVHLLTIKINRILWRILLYSYISSYSQLIWRFWLSILNIWYIMTSSELDYLFIRYSSTIQLSFIYEVYLWTWKAGNSWRYL